MILTNQKIKTRSLDEYNLVMNLRREKKGRGAITLSRMTGIPRHTIHDWIYRRTKPKCLRKTKILPSRAKKLSPELAYILGVIEGDGCLYKYRRHSLRGECYGYGLVLSVTDKDFADYFYDQVKKWCGFHLYRNRGPQTGIGYKDIYTIRLRSKDAYEFLKTFDLDELKESSEEIKCMFLNGFFDSEGHVPKRKNGFIHIGVVNLDIILLVRNLLQSLNIKFGSILEKNLTDKTFYYFHIGSIESLQRFKDKVGFSIKRKQDRLVHILDSNQSYKELQLQKEQYKLNKEVVYKLILNNQGISLSEIARKLNWDVGKASNYTKRMEKKGRIYKVPSGYKDEKLIFSKVHI